MRFCPELTVLPPNPGLVEKGCRVLAGTAARYTPVWEPFRPGHLYMDVTGTERLWGRAKDAAYRVRKEIMTTMSLSGSVGVAGNKMVAGIASRVLSSEGILDVDHGRESSFMAPLGVDFIPGIGHVRRRILLEELNISLVREIAMLDINNLKLIFGKQAWVIHQRALGIDPTPVHPPCSNPEVKESIAFSSDKNDDRKLLGALYSLVEKSAKRLRARGLVPARAGLSVRYADQVEVMRQTGPLLCDSSDFDLYPVLERLFLKACQRRTRVRSIKVWFRDLSSPVPQLSLFPANPLDGGEKAKLLQAIDRIRERHGDGAVKYGRAANAAGARRRAQGIR
jgi:DNA polymerase-4